MKILTFHSCLIPWGCEQLLNKRPYDILEVKKKKNETIHLVNIQLLESQSISHEVSVGNTILTKCSEFVALESSMYSRHSTC